MSFVVPYARTMAGARKIVLDQPVSERRAKIVALSRQWQREHGSKVCVSQPAERDPSTAYAQNRGAHPQIIISMVAAWHGVTHAEIVGDSRSRPVIEARHDAVAAVWLNCRVDGRQYSLPELGRAFGKDHTTCLHSLRKRGLK